MMRIAILIAAQVLGVGAHGPGGTRPGFIALRAQRPKASEGAADCDVACGEDAPKNCVRDCNSAVLQCMESTKVSNTKETQRCRKEILTGIKRVRTFNFPDFTEPNYNAQSTLRKNHTANNTLQNHTANNTLPDNKTRMPTNLAYDPTVVGNKCAGVCGDNVNSSCVTSCEMELYQCVDHTLPEEEAAGEREACFKKVLAKYSKFKEEWNATHGFVARHNFNTTAANVTVNTTVSNNKTAAKATVYYKVKDADLKMIKDVCNAACTKAGGGAPSSMCITHCETDMYRCIKETLPDEMDDRKKCRKDTQAKYENWGSSL